MLEIRGVIQRALSSSSRRVRALVTDPLRQFQLSLFLLLLLLAGGTLGYVWLESMDWVDGLYMTIITLTTVGFGEVQPLSYGGRIFTMGLILLGVGTLAWAVRNAAEVVVGQRLWISVRQRRMEDTLNSLSNHYIVCGYGRMGRQITRDLLARDEPFAVVDMSPKIAEELLEVGIPHVTGDATQDEVLHAAGIERAQGLVAALDTDADNVLAVLTARGLNPNLIIVARTATEEAESKLRRAGADRVVSPYIIGGHRLALGLLRPTVHDFLNHIFHFGGDLNMDVGQVKVGRESHLAGQTLAGCDLRRVWNLNVLAIQRPDGEFITSPDGNHTIMAGETLIVIGPRDAIYELESQLNTDAS